jgi:hypothetical protein
MTSWRVTGRLFIVVFLAFATGAVLSWESFGSTVGPSFFYPSGGVTAAAMILSRRALWPTIAAAVIAAEILVDSVYGNLLALSFAFAVSNVVEPIVGASIVLAWCGGRPDLRKRRDFVAFIAGACLAAPLVGGLVGGTASSILNGLPWPNTVLTWWSGDALGVLVGAHGVFRSSGDRMAAVELGPLPFGSLHDLAKVLHRHPRVDVTCVQRREAEAQDVRMAVAGAGPEVADDAARDKRLRDGVGFRVTER